MIMDKQVMFSEGQSVSGTMGATNIVDLGPVQMGASGIRFFVSGDPGVSGGGTITVKLLTSDKTTSATTLENQVSVCDFLLIAADLAKGGKMVDACLPARTKRFLKVDYVVSGTVTGAKLTAGLVLDTETH